MGLFGKSDEKKRKEILKAGSKVANKKNHDPEVVAKATEKRLKEEGLLKE